MNPSFIVPPHEIARQQGVDDCGRVEDQVECEPGSVSVDAVTGAECGE
jgi:hypothetical protein